MREVALARLVVSLVLALLLSLVLVGLAFSAAHRSPPAVQPTALTTPVWLGNPIFDEAYSARHIWDLQTWRGRVYLGYGDWLSNLGPVDIWYYTPTAGCFLSETVYVSSDRPAARVDEESIDRYVVIDGDLYIPGTDPRNSWRWGNFYRNDGTGWLEYRTIPHGIHTFDMGGYNGELFAAIGPDDDAPVVRSTNGGLTWTAAISEIGRTRFYELYELSGTLFAVKGPTVTYTKPTVYRYQPPWFVTTTIQLVPDLPDAVVYVRDDTAAFGGAVLYVPWFWDATFTCTQPLTALYAVRPDQDGQPVPFFDGKHPRDVIVAEDRVYVLDAGGLRCVWDYEPPDSASYTATIYASVDLTGWVPVATAHFPDTPNALEVLNGLVYVGTYNGDVYALPLRRYIYLPTIIRGS
jgi:hypothetical protein